MLPSLFLNLKFTSSPWSNLAFFSDMASNLASIALRTARSGLQNSIKAHGAQSSVRTTAAAPLPETIKKSQNQFGLPDETHVYRKGGPIDNITYRLTMGLCVACVGLIGMNIFMMARKK